MDELARGLVDEDEEAEALPTDRAYWESKSSKAMLTVADKLLEIVKPFDRALELKFNKYYIGLGRDGAPFNFVTIRPKKSTVTLEIKLPRTDDIDAKIEQAGMDTLEYNARWSYYRLRLTPADVTGKIEILRELMQLAFERRAS
jgi:predicted transport protein